MKKLTMLLAFGAATVCAFGEPCARNGEACACKTCACAGTCATTCAKGEVKPVWVLCRFDIKSVADRAEFTARMKEILETVRAEKGCCEYRLLGDCETDWKAPQRFGEKTLWMIEKWSSLEALQAHLQTPHMKKFGPSVKHLREHSTFHVLEDVCR